MMFSLCYQTHLKGAVTRQTITFLLSLFATKLENVLVNDKITALCETNMPPKQYIKRYKRQNRTFKTCWANKFPETKIALRFNLS